MTEPVRPLDLPDEWPDQPVDPAWNWRVDAPVAVIIVFAILGVVAAIHWAWQAFSALKASW